MKNFLRVVLLTLVVILSNEVSMARIIGVKNIPTAKVDLSQGLETGYYLLKQVNNNASAAGGQGVGWIKASSEAAGQPESVGATAEYPSGSRKSVGTSTANPDVLCVWYVEVVNAENKEIKISTANKIGSWYLPTGSQRQKGLTSYGNATVLKYHIGTATMDSQTATAKEGSCFISNSDVSSFIHFSGTELGSWSDANQGSMFMVEFYKLNNEDLKQEYAHNTSNINRDDDRKLNSFTITDGNQSLVVTSIQTSNTAPVYIDKSAQKLTTYAGATLKFSAFDYTGNWMHAYAYVDYNKDYYFELTNNNDGTTEGEIVSYNYLNGNTITSATGNDNGNALSIEYDGSKAMPAFTLPANLEPGEYRMRIKIDWNNLDADYGASDIAANGGCQCDITLVIRQRHSYTINATAGNGGSITINDESVTSKNVVEGSTVTLVATPDTYKKFVSWTDANGIVVSTDATYTFTATENTSLVANFDYIFPDGAYKIHWEYDGRGYLAYHATASPNEAKLADVTLGNHGGNHYNSSTDQVDLVWYLITANDGKRYLFQAATGKFLCVDESKNNPSGSSNSKANKLSTTEATPITIDANSSRSGHYVIKATANNTTAILSSGCGTSSKTGSPVRWWYDNAATSFYTDGGSPLKLEAVENVTVNESIIAFARNVINGKVQTISSCDAFLNNFENGKIYYFETSRGVLAATGNSNNLVSTARSSITIENLGMNNPYCQWTVYKSDDNKYYLYNIGKGMFMGSTTTNNGAIPFTQKPVNDGLVFKAANKNGYPIMFTCNTNTGAVNHSTNNNHEYGIVYWADGWDELNDDGNCHKVTLVGELDEPALDAIKVAVATVNTEISYKVEVEDWTQENPNTHFGGITFNCGGVEKKITLTTANFETNKIKADVSGTVSLSHSRKYRGFNFIGFSIDGDDLGQTPTLTDEQKNKLTNGTPLVAKFKTDGTGDVTLFYDDDEFSYRIPAIAKTGTNRLVAISDYRHSHDDIGRDNHHTGTLQVDLVMRTSEDNGLTWTAKQTIAEGNSNFGYGDAAVAVNGENILVMAVAGNVFFTNATATNKQKTYRIYSTNNGQSWEKQEVSNNLYTLFPNANGMFFGSGKLVVDPDFNGTGNARVYGAMLLNDGNNYVLYSDNWGETWNILGDKAAASANEPKVEILPNGQILLSARRNGGRTFNVFTYTDKANNAGTWSTATNGCNNGGNGTNGEIICLDAKRTNGKPTKILLQSQPNGSDRRNVSIWYKEISADETYTGALIASEWTMGKQVSTQLSAYSAMCLQANGEVALFFEEAPCHNDDATYGYSMVYVPLTIEEITKNNFLNPNADVEYVPVEFNIELTDAEGNIYRETLDYIPDDVAAALTAKYPFITLGENGELTGSDNVYTYTNTVTLPFKVSNAETTAWYNIYWPANGNPAFYPVYMSASQATDTYVSKVTESKVYGNSSYNTLNNGDKIAWSIYSVNNSFEFIFKNKLTEKFIKAENIATDNAQNVKYVEESNATAFTLLKKTGNYKGDYALVAKVAETTGYLCSTSATGYHYATHYNSNGHPGAWVKFAEAPDYQAIVDKLIADIDNFGAGEGKYVANDAISNINKDALATMPLNSLNTQKEAVQTVKESYSEITLSIPVANSGSVKILEEAVSHKFVPKGEVTIEAVPAAGYYFVNWTKPAAQAQESAMARAAETKNAVEVVSTENPYTVTVSEAISLEANFAPIVVTATLTDGQGNQYIVKLDGFTNGITKETVAAKLVEKYPYITLGTEATGITLEGGDAAYTYTNTVELPFKVTNTTYIWHNIYWPSNTSDFDYPVYWAASSAEDTYVPKVTANYAYGDNPNYNTKDGNDKISWAIYNVNNGFEFIFKNKVTQKYIKVTSVADGDAQNVVYVENADDATAFTIEKKPAGNDYSTPAQYALAANVGETKGYLCSSSAGYGYATHHKSNTHQGAWIEFVESPDYFTKIMDIGIILGLKFGAGDGKCIITEGIQEIIDAMQNSGSITLNNLTEYASRQEDAMNNWPAISLTINPEDCGTTSINGEENVKHKYIPDGYELALVATPAEGYHFDKWIDGTNEITTAEYTKTISGGKGDVIALTVNFAKNIYTINVTAGEGGSAMIGTETSASVEHGSEVTLTAVAKVGFRFVNWTKEGVEVSTDAAYTFTATADGEYTANFVEIQEVAAVRYCRIGYDFENSNRYYMQSVASGVTNKANALLMTEESGATSIFYYADSKLLSYDKGTYLNEIKDMNGTLGARGLQDVGVEGGDVEFNGNKIIVTNGTTSTVYLHANKSGTTYFVDRCGTDNCGTPHNFILEEVTTLPVTISSALHATFYAPVAVAIPEGVKAYVLKADSIPGIETYAWMTSLKNGIIPANTGVILKAAQGTYDFDIVDDDVENYDKARAEAVGNVLSGTVAKTKITHDAYILANRNGKIGLYPVAKNSYLDNSTNGTTVRFTNNSHKAYLPVTNDWFGEQLKNGTGFRFIYDDEETTGIEEFETENTETIYDLQGRKLSEITEPGIYIVGGKKVWIK